MWRGTEGAEVEGEVAVSSPAITLTEECRRSSQCQVKRAIDMLLPGNNRSAGIMRKLDCRTRDESLSLFLLSPRCYRACLCSQRHRAVGTVRAKCSPPPPLHTHTHTPLSTSALIYAQEGEWVVRGASFQACVHVSISPWEKAVMERVIEVCVCVCV